MSLETPSVNLNYAREQLLEVPLVTKLPENLRERFAALLLWVGTQVEFEDGAYIYMEGKSERNLGSILLDGRVTIEKDEQEVHTLTAPNLIGEAQQFTSNRERTASVRAVGLVLTLKFAWGDVGSKARELFSKEERLIIRKVIVDLAQERCVDIFDEAAEAAREEA